MKIKNYFTRTVSRLRAKSNLAITTTTSELTDNRFGMGAEVKNGEKINANTLTFLMYSKDNDNLFI